jgi:Bacterial extracellular solute-binding protein, family 7
VLRLASADPAGIEHEPAVAFFIDRVAKLSKGRLRIAVDERRAPWHEVRVLQDVARGEADLGWAHTRTFDNVGVRSFVALDAPMLIDGYGAEHAVLRSSLATEMLAGTRSAGLHGLAVLSGDLRSAGAHRARNRAGTATLTLRGGHWRLLFSEPGHTLERGTYAGTLPRTTWAYDGGRRDESYVSVVVGRDGGLRFHVVSASDLPFARATCGSHVFERIGQ